MLISPLEGTINFPMNYTTLQDALFTSKMSEQENRNKLINLRLLEKFHFLLFDGEYRKNSL